MAEKKYAVITGDIIGSTELTKASSTSWVNFLNKSLKSIGKNYEVPLTIYRGDGFQGVTDNISSALRDAIILRLDLISSFEKNKKYPRLDARIAIGIGNIDFVVRNRRHKVGEMDGDAFINSGRLLDNIKTKKRKLAIDTPWKELNSDFDLFCLMADRLISKWTKKQCEAIMYRLKEEKLDYVGEKLNITPSAVSRRLEGTDYDIVEKIIVRYSDKIKGLDDKELIWK